MYIRTFV